MEEVRETRCGTVAVVLGSRSDLEYGKRALKTLENHGVRASLHIYSAHRNPRELDRFLEKCTAKLYIAMAGLSAALPGYIASRTDKPVIGVPLPAGPLNGVDALLSIAQVPRGVPVAAVGIGAAENAALLAVRILRLVNGER